MFAERCKSTRDVWISVKLQLNYGRRADKGTKLTWNIYFPFIGDEILVVNGKSLQGMKHEEAIAVFKSIKTGDVQILIGRRMAKIRKTVEPVDVTKET